MDVHHNNNDMSSMESKASSSSNEHVGNNSLDDAVSKLLQGMRIQYIFAFYNIIIGYIAYCIY